MLLGQSRGPHSQIHHAGHTKRRRRQRPLPRRRDDNDNADEAKDNDADRNRDNMLLPLAFRFVARSRGIHPK